MPRERPALSTWCRPGGASTVAQFVALAERLGVERLVFDRTLDGATLTAFEPAALTRGLRPVAMEAPLPRPATGVPPALASDDRDERRAAADAVVTTIRRAAAVGANAVVVRLGTFEVRGGGMRDLARAHARRQLDADRIERIVAERAWLAPRALDRARFGLDRVLHEAGAAGVMVALVNRARWHDIPDEPELEILLDDFRGAPLAAWYDAAAAHVRETLGLAHDVLGRLGPRCRGAWLTDAAGLRTGLPWGRGEVDRARIDAGLPPEALRVVHCAPLATEAELAGALAD